MAAVAVHLVVVGRTSDNSGLWKGNNRVLAIGYTHQLIIAYLEGSIEAPTSVLHGQGHLFHLRPGVPVDGSPD